MADGITNSNRVEHLTERKLHAKVVDNVLSGTTYYSRLAGKGQPFMGKTMDFTIKISDSGQGQFFSGLESLNSAASDTTVTLSYAHTGFSQPAVSIMLESFANSGPEGTISLDAYKMEEAVAEARTAMSTAIYGDGTGDQPNGLAMLIDDGTTSDNIGGLSRTTYTNLKGTVTASGGTMSLSKMATLFDTISAAGHLSEEPSIILTTKAVWSLYETLLSPTVRASYQSLGLDRLPVRGDSVVKASELQGAAGFSALSYRGIPMIKDDAATSGVMFMINENYLTWKGRTLVPDKYKGILEKVNLGQAATIEGVGGAPSNSHGWFFQKPQVMENQAGMIGRYYVIGQVCTSQPRRHGKLTGITSV